MKTEDTAGWAADDTAVALDDVDDTAAAVADGAYLQTDALYCIIIWYEYSMKSIIIISSMQRIIVVKNNPNCIQESHEVSCSDGRVSTLSCSLLDSMTYSFIMLSDHLTLGFDLDLEADEVADVGADCTSGGQL